MATLREYFEMDFSRYLRIAISMDVNHGGAFVVSARASVCQSDEARARFLALYLDDCRQFATTCYALARDVQTALDAGKYVETHGGFMTDETTSSKDLVFTNRMFVYANAHLGQDERGAAVAAAKTQGIALVVRDHTYMQKRTEFEKPLAFICHDSRDKEAIARPLATALTQYMCPVWYDEYSLKVGDRLRESIEKGLRECHKCVLVITPNFIGNGGWTQTEFDSIFTRELLEKRDVVLPVWHGVTKEDVYNYSPQLLNRMALQWSAGEKEVAAKLLHAIRGA